MKCFVTGSTGFIGNNLVIELLDRGYQVNLLVRSKHKLANDLIEKTNVFDGDLNDKVAIDKAMKGCDYAFHLAAYANIWSKDKSLSYKTNVEGTRHILDAALRNGIRKMVFTSSAATMAPSQNKEEVDETFPVPDKYTTDYEITKREAELLCMEYSEKGLDVSIVNPPRVFGPGMMSKSNSVTVMIKLYASGWWRIIPGNGKQIGNYAFVNDVVNGHIGALQLGRPGERYILGGSNISYNQFFEILARVSGKKRLMLHLPYPLMLFISKLELFMADNFGKKPLITPPWVRRYLQNRLLSSQKAATELGYTITPLEESIRLTIAWINEKRKEHG